MELCEFAHKICAVISDMFSFDAQNDAAMLGQASTRGISANDMRMPEHRPYMQFEGG